MGGDTRVAGLAVGDRVTIVGRGHPWRGYSGEIVAPFGRPGLDWTIALDAAGHRVAAADGELRVERGGAR